MMMMMMMMVTSLFPDLPPPSTRERPPGCKTVFVGGLPENATEEIIREVFDQCGEIIAIRKSKKNFCHIRFSEEFMVDKAIYLSGECAHTHTHTVQSFVVYFKAGPYRLEYEDQHQTPITQSDSWRAVVQKDET